MHESLQPTMANGGGHTNALDLTVILPAYNEQDAILSVIEEVREALSGWTGTWEILVVDDASTDETAVRSKVAGVRVLQRHVNGGSGASRKTGIRAARGALVAMLDADGSYMPSFIVDMLAEFPCCDQVNGARISEQGEMPRLRSVVKGAIRRFAELLSGYSIPDLNTGMKVFRRDVALRYLWIVPDGFSCVTSLTLAFLCNQHIVRYVPVGYRPRIGKSKFRPVRDTAMYIRAVIWIIATFCPIRASMPFVAASVVAICALYVRIPAARIGRCALLFGLSLLALSIAGVYAIHFFGGRRPGTAAVHEAWEGDSESPKRVL